MPYHELAIARQDARTLQSLSGELHAINRELAGLLGTRPAELTLGAETTLTDELVVCGILGGKNVGKTTLINALAQCEVSVDPVEVGKGTERPMAYVHEEMQQIVADRLGDLGRHGGRPLPIDVSLHKADAIRNAVLVDLPDFDSEFKDHLEIVRTIAPLLDRVLWVVTPRKIGDRVWVEMFHSVIKDPGNVHCVLNKVDELLGDAEPFDATRDREGASKPRREREGASQPPKGNAERAQTFWAEQVRWVGQSAVAAGCPHSEEHQFLVGAAFDTPDRFVGRIGELWDDPEWSKYAEDRETVTEIAQLACDDLSRLRSCVLSAIPRERASAIKEANRIREEQVNVERLRKHFDLDRVTERLTQACDPEYYRRVLAESMGPDYCAAVGAALQTRLRTESELADDLLERRVENWPLLRLVHWPLGWLSRLLGRRVSPAGRPPTPEIADPFDVEGRPLSDRIELLRLQVLADNALAVRQFNLEPQLPPTRLLCDRVRAAGGTLLPSLETRLLEDIRSRDRRPSLIGKAALWFLFLWFPFLQPILAGVLEMFTEPGGLNTAHGLYKIVSAFSAVHLLTGFAVVLGVFVMLLAAMYARALRAVRRLRLEQSGASPLAEAVDEILIAEIVVPLARPFQERFERLTSLQNRLNAALKSPK